MAYSHELTGQPSTTFLNFVSNGVDLTAYPRFTRKSFSHSFSDAQHAGAGEFSLELFDENWSDIESVLFRKGGDLNASFSYGYAAGLRSQAYSAVITNVESGIDETGSTLTISGHSTAILSHLQAKNRSFKDTSISEIFKIAALEAGFLVGEVEPTRKLISLADNSSHRPFQMAHRSFHQFVNTALVPYAVSEITGMGGYQTLYKDVVDSAGRKKVEVSFHPPDFSPAGLKKKLSREYIFMKSKSSEVISWAPKIDLITRYGTNGGIIDTPFIDPFTKEIKVLRADASQRPRDIPSRKQKHGVDLPEPAGSVYPNRFRIIPAQTEEAIAQRQNAVMDSDVLKDNFDGTLTVIGDPTVPPFSLVRLFVFTNRFDKKNMLPVEHYTSGVYTVKKITHNLGDTFETAMDLGTYTSQGGTGVVKPA